MDKLPLYERAGDDGFYISEYLFEMVLYVVTNTVMPYGQLQWWIKMHK